MAGQAADGPWESGGGGPAAPGPAAPLAPLLEERLANAVPGGAVTAILVVMAVLLAGWTALYLALGYTQRAIDPATGFVPGHLWFAVLASFGVAYGLIGLYRERRSGLDDIRALAPLTVGGCPDVLERRWRAAQEGSRPLARRMGLLGLGIAAAGTLGFLAGPALRADTAGELRILTLSFWYCLTWMVSFWLVFRGFTLQAAEDTLVAAIGREARVDLLDTGPLLVFGRRGLHGMVSGIVAATALSLVIVHPLVGPHPLAVAGMVILIVKAVWDSATPLRIAHAAIRRAKSAELSRIQPLIRARAGGMVPPADQAPGRAAPSGTGAPALADLLAWEARVERVPEWPITIGTSTRFLGLLATPALGWIASNGLAWVLDRLMV
ncbi:MAG: hypothetical protein RLY86_3796 [Pseudomonadota bacterium]|jgi:hypothetical protein